MAINVAWPASSEDDQISISTSNSNSPKPVARGSEEFDRFESLTRKLVQVPKGELVEKKD